MILAEEVEGRTRGVGARVEFLGILQAEVQKEMDALAREFALVFVLHRDGSSCRRMHQTTRTQIGDLYAVVVHGTQELFDLAEQLNWRCPPWECERTNYYAVKSLIAQEGLFPQPGVCIAELPTIFVRAIL